MDIQLKRGLLDVCVLAAIKNQDSYGYQIIKDIKEYLDEIEGDGKDPSPMAKMMSWAKINMKMMMHEDDKTIASLIIDGCNMGIKQLTGYLNEYTEADEKSMRLAKRLINEEENLSDSLKKYL